MRRGANGTSERPWIEKFSPFVAQSISQDVWTAQWDILGTMWACLQFVSLSEHKGRKDAVLQVFFDFAYNCACGISRISSLCLHIRNLEISGFVMVYHGLPIFYQHFLPYFTLLILWQIYGDLTSSVLPIFSFAAIPFLGTPNSRAALPRDSENQPDLSCKKPREHTWNTVPDTLFWTL